MSDLKAGLEPDLLTRPVWPDPNPTRPGSGSGRVEVRPTRGVGRVGLALPGRVLGYPTGAGFTGYPGGLSLLGYPAGLPGWEPLYPCLPTWFTRAYLHSIRVISMNIRNEIINNRLLNRSQWEESSDPTLVGIGLILMKMLMVEVYSLILHLVHATYLCSLRVISMDIRGKIIVE